MRLWTSIRPITALASLLLFTQPLSAEVPKAVMPAKHLAVFQKYCLDCHDAETKKGKVNLEALSFNITTDIPTAELWFKVLDSLNSGEMPPEDKKQISREEKGAFLQDLSIQMVTARSILSDSSGLITMRRLNRREYENTMEALLGFKPDVSTLPADDSTGGFDTTGASLFFSSDQFEQYRAVATVALEKVLTPRSKPETQKRRIEPEKEISEPIFERAEPMLAHLKQAQDFLKLPEAEQTEEVAKKYDLKDVEHAHRVVSRFDSSFADLQDYIRRPEAKTGAVLVHTKNRTPGISTSKIAGATGGRYILRVRAGCYDEAPERERYLEYSLTSGKSNSRVLGQVKVTGSIDKPVTLEIPIDCPLDAEGHYTVRQRDYGDKDSRRHANDVARKENGIGQPPTIWVDYVELEGPFYETWPNPKQAELLPEKKSDESDAAHARRVITSFATRACREKSLDPEFLNKLVARYTTHREAGDTEIEAFIDVYALILASPSFVYLSEPRAGDAPARLSNRELAVRLSYFLWSAPPDAELMACAKSGTLSDAKVLAQQTDRLLKDRRSDAFIHSFAHQWLDMTRLDMFDFNAAFHPQFDEAVRRSARAEVYETIRHVIDEGLPLQTLLKADFVIVNDVLADFYGLPGVNGAEFRKVALPPKSPRGGLLGAAATHIMGSDGQRSSPVERGAWVLRHLLNDPPPPAPPNVPMLSRLSGEVLAARALQKAHQEEPQCAQCHQKIDPIGFGMENVTAAGLWRETEEVVLPVDEEVTKKKKAKPGIQTFPINPTGTLPTGEAFRDYFGLRDAVAAHGKAFARGFTEHLIAYALGRPFGVSDHNFASEIVEQAGRQKVVIPAFIHAIVQSDKFHSK